MAEILHQRYELLAKVGSGGTGEVYKALDRRLKRMVAIKRVRSSRRGNERLLRRLLREAENLARVEHPNVVMVHDILETESSVSIVMELVKGTPFVKSFRKRGIPESEYLGYFLQLLAAVEAVHEVGMIHRDINPRNIVVSREGVVKLTDFGLSVSVSDSNIRLGGTLGYMAPETLRKNHEIGFAVDIYSLGFLTYQAMLGIRAFKTYYGAKKPRDWMRWLLSREAFKTLDELEAPVSRGMSRIVARMLEKDHRKRYQKIQEVRRDLQRHVLGKGKGDSTGERSRARSRTQRGGSSLSRAFVGRLLGSASSTDLEETSEDSTEPK